MDVAFERSADPTIHRLDRQRRSPTDFALALTTRLSRPVKHPTLQIQHDEITSISCSGARSLCTTSGAKEVALICSEATADNRRSKIPTNRTFNLNSDFLELRSSSRTINLDTDFHELRRSTSKTFHVDLRIKSFLSPIVSCTCYVLLKRN
jgi:hypothetical protein